MFRKQFITYRQHDSMDCGPACIRMVARHHGKVMSQQWLQERTHLSREGVSLQSIAETAESIGFRTLSAKVDFPKLQHDAAFPCIIYWEQRHFMVVHKITSTKVHVADPAHGLVTFTHEEFKKGWLVPGEGKGVLLLLEPGPDFSADGDDAPRRKGLGFLLRYLAPYRRYMVQLAIGMVAGSLFQLIFPFLTQALVDTGIQHQNLGFVHLILIAQLVTFFSRTLVELVRGRILLHVGTRINISLISDFLIKVMRLPMGFFDSQKMGDLLQRVADHKRIENFLTTSTLAAVFGILNLALFGGVLAWYSTGIFLLFLAGSALYVGWILFFMRRRRQLDYKRFSELAESNSQMVEMIGAMQEIKLHNAQHQKRWDWERIQARLFRINMRTLGLTQYQDLGAGFINELKNILISFVAASLVINGQMSLGVMMAISYIIGQMNGPITQLISFFQGAQDAKIALERISEIHDREEEEPAAEARSMPQVAGADLVLKGVSFRYQGPHSPLVLDNLDLTLPSGKVTAIVGTSGSGKTTLLKLLLKFYPPTEGEISVGGDRLANLQASAWRDACGVVMQDGHIFNDTILRNIAMTDGPVDRERMLHAVTVANLRETVEALPLGYATKVGSDGMGLSAGQRQRILIARAVYKDPQVLCFDEATSALDANNERTIMGNLDAFCKGRTTVVIAHRLSTVRHAHQIVVLHKGRITERGTHEELVARQGDYYHLIRNQLELGQ